MAPEAPESVRERVERVESLVLEACRRAGRSRSEVTLIGASKRQPIELLQAAVDAGLRDLGENRVQEAEEKKPHLRGDLRWHLIGPLQSNKARRAVELFDVVHSVDRDKIARKLAKEAERADLDSLPVFLEVHLGDEDTKHGYPPASLVDAFSRLREVPRLDVRGLMSIPPPDEPRRWFQELRRLRDQLRARQPDWPGDLSMGMSGDFEIAIEEGATHVRVGTALFGPRPEA